MMRFGAFLLAILSALGPAAPVDAVSTSPIRIGTTLSLEGKYREPAAMMLRGYRLWERQVNERGGLLGRPVALVVHDDKSRTDLVESYYRQMLGGDHPVDLVLSPYGTPLTLAALPATEAHRTVLLACAASGAKIWDRGADFVFGVYAPADRYFIGLLDLMARNAMETVGIVYEDSPFHHSIADGVRLWSTRFGVRVTADGNFDPRSPDLETVMSAMSREKPAALIVSAYPPQAYAIIDWMIRHRFRPPALALTIAPVHPDFAERVGSFAEGVFAPSQWEPDERIPFPGTEQFIRDFREAYGVDPSYHAGSAYAACQILERAAVHTGALDQTRIRDFIRALDTVTVIGRFKVDHTGKQVGHNPILIQWQDGQKQIVYPKQMKTAPVRFDTGAGR